MKSLIVRVFVKLAHHILLQIPRKLAVLNQHVPLEIRLLEMEDVKHAQITLKQHKIEKNV